MREWSGVSVWKKRKESVCHVNRNREQLLLRIWTNWRPFPASRLSRKNIGSCPEHVLGCDLRMRRLTLLFCLWNSRSRIFRSWLYISSFSVRIWPLNRFSATYTVAFWKYTMNDFQGSLNSPPLWKANCYTRGFSLGTTNFLVVDDGQGNERPVSKITSIV